MTRNSFYAAYAVRNSVVALGSYVLLRAIGIPASRATVLAMGVTLIALAIVTVVEKMNELPDEVLMRHVRVTRMITMATAAVASCFAAAQVSGHLLFAAFGFVLGVAYCVYALRKEIDDDIAPMFLLFAAVTQTAIVFGILTLSKPFLG